MLPEAALPEFLGAVVGERTYVARHLADGVIEELVHSSVIERAVEAWHADIFTLTNLSGERPWHFEHT